MSARTARWDRVPAQRLLALLVVLLVGCSDAATPAAMPALEAPGAVRTSLAAAAAAPGVIVTPAELERLGLQLASIDTRPIGATASGIAVVLDGSVLTASLAELAAARTEARIAQESRRRLQGLYDDNRNASRVAVDAARAQAATAAARVAAASTRLRLDWSPRLSEGQDAHVAALRAAIAQGRAVLLRAEFPSALPGDVSRLEYSPILDEGALPKVSRLDFIDRSRASTLVTSGDSVLLSADAASRDGPVLRPGDRIAVVASVAERSEPERPVVPAGAVIADGGRLWFYVMREQGRFERIAVASGDRTAQGYVASGIVRAGDRVVVGGAALLFSRERMAGPSGAD